MLMAQLYTQGKYCGVQPFIVQLRDEETHKPMPGVTIGEIGTKLGFNTVNNGFLGLKDVHIPRKNMLMKNAEVTESGEFVKKRSALLSYGTMTMTRVGIILDSNVFLAKAAIIAVRYSLVRRQSPIEPDKPEPKIMDHVTQQYKVLPVLAKSIVINITAKLLWEMHDEVMAEIEKGDLNRLPEIHALSCSLKAMCTDEAAAGAETCRLSCGGHGYLNSSGFPDIYKMITPGQTYEGENTVLYLQTARYLLKTWQQILSGARVTSTVAYLKNYADRSSNHPKEIFDTSPRGILRAMQSATAGHVAKTFKNLQQKMKTATAGEAANQCGIEMVKIGKLHAKVFMLQSAVSELEKAASKSTPQLSYIFRDILELYSVDLANNSIGDLMQVLSNQI
jgi:acyl-CoA oxidase